MKFKFDNFLDLPEPLLDRLADANPEVRCQAIRDLRGKYSRVLINTLWRLKNNSNPQVSQAANDKLTRFEMHLRKQIFFFHQWVKKDPDSPAAVAGSALSYFRFAQFWVQDDGLRKYFLQKALDGFNLLIRAYQPKLLYFYYRGLVLMALGEYRLAAANFGQILKKHPHRHSALLKLIEIFYHLGYFRFIPPLCRRINTTSLPRHVARYIDYWQ